MRQNAMKGGLSTIVCGSPEGKRGGRQAVARTRRGRCIDGAVHALNECLVSICLGILEPAGWSAQVRAAQGTKA